MANEKSFLLLVSAITTPMMSASGLGMPARKRGFWFRMAASSVLPERGSPDMKWNLRAGVAVAGAAGMRAVSLDRNVGRRELRRPSPAVNGTLLRYGGGAVEA